MWFKFKLTLKKTMPSKEIHLFRARDVMFFFFLKKRSISVIA